MQWNKYTVVNSLKILLFMSIMIPTKISAHCDSIEGPVVKAAVKAIETGNINYVLIWIPENEEPELIRLFDKVLRVRVLNDEVKELADLYFFETAVRLHRMGEGVGYTGIKPAGYQPEAGISEADNALQEKNLDVLLSNISSDHSAQLIELYSEVLTKSNYDVNDLRAGREYVEAYVHFMHFVEEIYSDRIHNEKSCH